MAIIGTRSSNKSVRKVPEIKTDLIILQNNGTATGESNTFTSASWNGQLCRSLNFVANRAAQRIYPICRINRRAAP